MFYLRGFLIEVKFQHSFSIITNDKIGAHVNIRNPNHFKWKLDIDWREIEIAGKYLIFLIMYTE